MNFTRSPLEGIYLGKDGECIGISEIIYLLTQVGS